MLGGTHCVSPKWKCAVGFISYPGEEVSPVLPCMVVLVQATGRLRKNAHYFKVNYLMVVFTVTLITLAFNPTSLIVLGLLAMAWIYLFVVRQAPIVIGGRTFRCLPDPLVG